MAPPHLGSNIRYVGRIAGARDAVAPAPLTIWPARWQLDELRALRAAVCKHADEKRALATQTLALLKRVPTAEETIKARDRIIARLEAMLRGDGCPEAGCF